MMQFAVGEVVPDDGDLAISSKLRTYAPIRSNSVSSAVA
jgi:hypothetical protein